MKTFLRQQLDRYAQRLEELDFLLSREDIMADMAQYRLLSKEHAQVTQIAGRYLRLKQREADLAGAREMLEDPDMAEMAREEIASTEPELVKLEDELQRLLLPKDPDDARNAFLEIRAGTGGDESALFAGDLLRMYTRYAERQGWRSEIVSESEGDVGGFKEVVVRMVGDSAYGKLKFESGGHRVQRVPATESQGRIHTSACTVAALAEPDEATAVQINPSDLRIDTFRASGAGGQHINKTDSAVRITHLPTGLVVECQDDRSQHRNKAKAMQVLSARIQEKERSERAAREAATRKGLIGSGDRSDRIRTYNFPQGRLTDHRINLTLYKLLAIMEGDLGDVLAALQAAREAEQLAELEVGPGARVMRTTILHTVAQALAGGRAGHRAARRPTAAAARSGPHRRGARLADRARHRRADARRGLASRSSRSAPAARPANPVAYLVGEKEFHGLDLQVDARVLVPRPDTETLVEWALECLHGRKPRAARARPGHRQRRQRARTPARSPRCKGRCRRCQRRRARRGARQWRAARPRRCASPRPTGWPAPAPAMRSSWPTRPTSPTATLTSPALRPRAAERPGLRPRRPRRHPPHRRGQRRPTWRTAAGCCWNTATTRRPPCTPCSPNAASATCKAATTSPASRAAPAESGAQ